MLPILLSLYLLIMQLPERASVPSKKMAAEKNLELQIFFPENQKRIQLNSCLNVNVLIINHTDTVTSFFEDWNSWGYFNISFQIRSGDTTYTVYKKDRDWDKNFPSFKTLFPGDTMQMKFSLNINDCDSSPFNGKIQVNSKRPETIKAAYKLNREVLRSADLQGFIMYKEVYIPDKWIVIDSLKAPVEINRTFPVSKLESNEYKL